MHGEPNIRKKICTTANHILTEMHHLNKSCQSYFKNVTHPYPHITYNIKDKADGAKHAQIHNDYILHEQQMTK
jgi:hypothetical protein